jgi:cholesterol oxidase
VDTLPTVDAPQPRSTPDAPDADGRQPTTLSFTEEMKGVVTLGESDPRRGAERGREGSGAFMFHLTITVEDMDHFLVDADREGVAEGWVECAALGGRLPVERGVFNLFVHTPADGGDPRRSRMLYRLHFRDGDGAPVTMTGFKDVHDDPGFDAWSDTSTLFVRLLAGHVGPDGDDAAPVRGAGVIRILVHDFAEQLTTFRTSGPDAVSRVRALEAFGRVFLGELWNTYGPRVLDAAGSSR